MIIQKSTVNLASANESERITKSTESMRAWVDGPGKEGGAVRSRPEAGGDSVKISVEYEIAAASLEAHTESLVEEGDDVWAVDAKLGMMKQIIEYMMGRRIETSDIQRAIQEGEKEAVESTERLAKKAEAGEDRPDQVERQGWGIEYDSETVTVERESSRFSASGVVATEDGEIAFETEMEMSRERIDVERFSFRAGDARLVDPLVVNFAGTTAQLTDEKFGFDLNVDGEDEQISFVKSGGGFLVYDKNGDNVINDGSELFGPTSGDGFSELAGYDDDGNGWIDEADTIFHRLGIWTRGEDGDHLEGLLSRNIGAIYLGNAYTPFELSGSDGAMDGKVRATGVYLEEDGTGVGTIQEVDLVT